MQQLDIFADSRDRMLLNDLAAAVSQHDAAAARHASAALRSEFPDDGHLPAAELLIAALDDTGTAPWHDLADALAARAHITHTLALAANTLLGAGTATPWLAARWRSAAQRAAALPYRADAAAAHAAALWLEAGAWANAAAAAERIDAWRHLPQPLAWVAQARWRQHGADAAWPLLAELCWLAPQRAQALVAACDDAAVRKLARRFDTAFEPAAAAGGWAWWPAWLLVEQPLLARPLDTAQTDGEQAPERCFKLVQSLLRLERAGRHHEVIEHRRRLQQASAPLFAAYMATR